jgi:V/A-type H+-transporting ATPase subunit E
MEVKLEKLIEKIKNEGVGSAKKEADKIIKDAQDKAKNELESAQKEIKTQEENSKKEIDSYRSNANDSIKQAARDTIISVRDEIKKLFNNALNKKIVGSFDEDLMKNIIFEMLINYKKWLRNKLEMN